MCSFDYHFHRAMEYEDDLVWIMAVYYNLMRAICMIYYWDNESAVSYTHLTLPTN